MRARARARARACVCVCVYKNAKNNSIFYIKIHISIMKRIFSPL